MLRDKLPKIVTQLPGPKAKAIIEKRENNVPAAIKCSYPCVIERGEGAMLEDVDGNVFLDWVGGVGVMNIGYGRPELIEAVKIQSEKYFHGMMNIVTHEPYIKLAETMNRIVPVRGESRQTMFANSGAEANENAVKIARGYTGRPNIIVFSGAFHGRTSLTMTMTGNKAYSIGMGPFPEGVYRAEFPYVYRFDHRDDYENPIDFYIESLEKLFDEETPKEKTAAIIFEPVQGEGGFVPAPIEWVQAVRKICDDNGILMIADEVQCGFARSGKMFASEYFMEAGCAPDVITTAKSIAGGIPLSAVTARREIFDKVPTGTIGGTYCGNALACAAGIKVVEIMEKEDYPAKALAISEKCFTAMNSWKEKYSVIGDVRGLGSMIGIEFVTDRESAEPNDKIVGSIIQKALEEGLILEGAGIKGNIIRFLCPLCVTNEQLYKGLEIFEKAIAASI